MKLEKNNLIKELEKEQEELNDLAFELFCKDKLLEYMQRSKKSWEQYIEDSKRLEDLSIDMLKKWFEKAEYSSCGENSIKEKYKKVAKEQLKK